MCPNSLRFFPVKISYSCSELAHVPPTCDKPQALSPKERCRHHGFHLRTATERTMGSSKAPHALSLSTCLLFDQGAMKISTLLIPELQERLLEFAKYIPQKDISPQFDASIHPLTRSATTVSRSSPRTRPGPRGHRAEAAKRCTRIRQAAPQ